MPPTRLSSDALRIAEEACAGETVEGRTISRINALRPSSSRPRMPDGLPSDLADAMRSARNGGREYSAACLSFAEWRFSVLALEQAEAQKVETLFWLWRTFASSDDPVHRSEAVALVKVVLKNAWGVDMPLEPLGFAEARRVASRVTRRLEDLPMAWRAL